MPRYLVQTSHDPSLLGCQRAFEELAAHGSHFLAQTDWGCDVGEHTGWLIVEAKDDADAQRMVPPVFRKTASVVRLNRYTPEQFRSEHRMPPQSNLESTLGSADEALKHSYGAENWLALRRKLQPGINRHQEEVGHATQYQDE